MDNYYGLFQIDVDPLVTDCDDRCVFISAHQLIDRQLTPRLLDRVPLAPDANRSTKQLIRAVPYWNRESSRRGYPSRSACSSGPVLPAVV